MVDGSGYLRDLETVEVPVGELHEYEGNAKAHTREQLDAVEASIREFGFSNPVLAWHDAEGRAVIVAGHARVKAARALGMDRVPCIFLDSLTDAQRRALTLADNQTTMMTGWDADALASELDALAGEFDMGDFGFGSEEIVLGEDGLDCAKGPDAGSLSEMFGVPPFSVLDARGGAWQERKRAWMALGIRSELGRGAAPGGRDAAQPARGGGVG